MLDRLTADSFAEHRGTDFMLDTGEDAVLELRLDEVIRYQPQSYAPRTEPFSLFFVGPATPVLPQRIYYLDHEEMGSMELFLVPRGPVGRDDPRIRYEAAFN